MLCLLSALTAPALAGSVTWLDLGKAAVDKAYSDPEEGLYQGGLVLNDASTKAVLEVDLHIERVEDVSSFAKTPGGVLQGRFGDILSDRFLDLAGAMPGDSISFVNDPHPTDQHGWWVELTVTGRHTDVTYGAGAANKAGSAVTDYILNGFDGERDDAFSQTGRTVAGGWILMAYATMVGHGIDEGVSIVTVDPFQSGGPWDDEIDAALSDDEEDGGDTIEDGGDTIEPAKPDEESSTEEDVSTEEEKSTEDKPTEDPGVDCSTQSHSDCAPSDEETKDPADQDPGPGQPVEGGTRMLWDDQSSLQDGDLLSHIIEGFELRHCSTDVCSDKEAVSGEYAVYEPACTADYCVDPNVRDGAPLLQTVMVIDPSIRFLPDDWAAVGVIDAL